MLNQIILVGRLTATPEVKKSDDGKERSHITIAVPRSYKNINGEYETDFVDCILWGPIATNTSEYCRKGDMIGVKGRIETNSYETPEGEKKRMTRVVAEKVTFLSTAKEKEASDKEI